jgi:hypothetical protein
VKNTGICGKGSRLEDLDAGATDTFCRRVGIKDLSAAQDCIFSASAESIVRSFHRRLHSTTDFIYDPQYLNIRRTDDLVIIQITMSSGRTLDVRKALYTRIADRLNQEAGLRKEDVFINLIEVAKENWSFGNGEAQYAT